MQINLISFIVFALTTILFCLLIFLIIRLMLLNKQNKNEIVERNIEVLALLKTIETLREEQDSNKIENTQGFLKFVSESREWAFSYIEDVQEAINNFKKIVGPPPKNRKLTKEENDLATSTYDKLISFLPTEDDGI